MCCVVADVAADAFKPMFDPDALRQNLKPSNWYQYPYPFICGQYDQQLFPISDWRECCRDAVAINAVHDWARDQIDRDNPELINQIHRKVLPRRGVWADPEEILITTILFAFKPEFVNKVLRLEILPDHLFENSISFTMYDF